MIFFKTPSLSAMIRPYWPHSVGVNPSATTDGLSCFFLRLIQNDRLQKFLEKDIINWPKILKWFCNRQLRWEEQHFEILLMR